MSRVFNHAIWWEFTERNPIAGQHEGLASASQAPESIHLTFSTLKVCRNFPIRFGVARALTTLSGAFAFDSKEVC
jgi:hypothetical protein